MSAPARRRNHAPVPIGRGGLEMPGGDFVEFANSDFAVIGRALDEFGYALGVTGADIAMARRAELLAEWFHTAALEGMEQ